MADSYTSSLLLTQPEVNANQNVWGGKLNASFGSALLEQAIVGVQSYALSANKTLTRTNGAADEARMRVQNITSATAAFTVTIPAVPIWYLVRNGSAFDQTISNGSNSVTIKAGNSVPVFSDGTNIYQFRCLDYGADLPRSTGVPSVAAHFTTKSYVDQLAFSTVLPGQAGQTGFLSTDGSIASWRKVALGSDVSGTLPVANGGTGVGTLGALKTALSLENVENKSSTTIRAEFVAAANTFTDKQTMAASTATRAGLRLQAGVAPTTPADGDTWTTTAGMFSRVNGVTHGPFGQKVTLIESKPSTSGTSVSFTAIPAHFTSLLVTFQDVSNGQVINESYSIALSGDAGATWTANSTLSITATGNTIITGSALIAGHKLAVGSILASLAPTSGGDNIAPSRPLNGASGGAIGLVWKVAAGISGVRISSSVGFTAGTIALYGID